jgi:hypothetical protein
MRWSLVLLLLVGPVGRPIADAGMIELTTPSFTIALDPATCLATTTITQQLAPGGAVRSSTPVPFVSLYNRVADSRPTNLSPCDRVALLSQTGRLAAGPRGPGLTVLQVFAAHGGSLQIIANTTSSGHLFFRLGSLAGWGGDPVERHLEFGAFWTGILENSTAPIMMGRLQGPRGNPGTGEISAGFMTISPRSYYRFLFYAQEGDELAFGFAGPSSREVANLWLTAGRERGIDLMAHTNRFNTFFWTEMTEDTAMAVAARATVLGVDTIMIDDSWHPFSEELAVSDTAYPKGINHTVSMLRERFGLKVGLHTHPLIVWPCVANSSSAAKRIGVSCLASGKGIAHTVMEHKDALVAEALAPTFRAGTPGTHSEDLGFWWCHDPRHFGNETTVARNGNPKPCGQGSCNTRDWESNSWAPDIELTETIWSTQGFYRGGWALGFDG